MLFSPKEHCGISSTVLKWLALVFMTLDHVGVFLFPQYTVFRALGRLAFPLFAFTVGESLRHTRHPLRYFLCLAVPGVLMQVIYFAALHSLDGNIFITFAISAVNVFLVKWAQKPRRAWLWAVLALALVLEVFVCYDLRVLLGTPRAQLIMYEFPGILLPMAVALLPNKHSRFAGFALLLGGMCLVEQSVYRDFGQWFCMAALLPIAFYSGDRGKYSCRWFFYIYYPAHLVAIYGISLLVR